MVKVKENAMKACQLITALALGLVLSACQGANPFQRTSDPLKDYSTLKNFNTLSKVSNLRPEISLGADFPVDGASISKATKFKVNVYDHESTSVKADDSDAKFVNLKTALKVVASDSLEATERDGSAATSCVLDGQPSLGDGNWQYSCTFDPKKIGTLDKSATYVFDLKLKSVFSNLDELTPLKVALTLTSKTQGGK